jgi:hypothetical protein
MGAWVGVNRRADYIIGEEARNRHLALCPAEPDEVWIGASAPSAIDRAAQLAEGLDRESRPHPR